VFLKYVRLITEADGVPPIVAEFFRVFCGFLSTVANFVT
jgi:hypothetical protein